MTLPMNVTFDFAGIHILVHSPHLLSDTHVYARRRQGAGTEKLIPGWLNRARFHHKYNRSLGRSGAMHHPSRYGYALMGIQFNRSLFRIDEQLSLDDKKEFIVVIMLVPVVFSLDDPQPHYALVHPGQRLIEPRNGNCIYFLADVYFF